MRWLPVITRVLATEIDHILNPGPSNAIRGRLPVRASLKSTGTIVVNADGSKKKCPDVWTPFVTRVRLERGSICLKAPVRSGTLEPEGSLPDNVESGRWKIFRGNPDLNSMIPLIRHPENKPAVWRSPNAGRS